MTPLKACLSLSLGPIKLCNTCLGTDNVVCVNFGWSERPEDVVAGPPHSGGTTVALCRPCRGLAIRLLEDCT